MAAYYLYRNKNYNPTCFWSIWDNGTIHDVAEVFINVPSQLTKVDLGKDIPNFVVKAEGMLKIDEKRIAHIDEDIFNLKG